MIKHDNLPIQLIQGAYFIAFTTFNLAHWLFAFSYLALSFKIELFKNQLPEDTHKCRLNLANILVCILNVLIPAVVWGSNVKKEI